MEGKKKLKLKKKNNNNNNNNNRPNNNIYTGQSREASANIAMAMSFLRRTYPDQLTNYTGNDLPDALDLITATLTTPTPTDGPQLSRRRRRRRRNHPWKELDFQVYCRRQLETTHDAGLSSTPDPKHGGLTEFWRKRRKPGRRRRRPGSLSTAGAMAGRSTGVERDDVVTPRTLERGNENDGRPSTFVVTEAFDTADGGQSSIIAASMDTSLTADSAAAGVREGTTAVYNVAGFNLYFRTAYLLHYASIVILGLFVLQVSCYHSPAFQFSNIFIFLTNRQTVKTT